MCLVLKHIKKTHRFRTFAWRTTNENTDSQQQNAKQCQTSGNNAKQHNKGRMKFQSQKQSRKLASHSNKIRQVNIGGKYNRWACTAHFYTLVGVCAAHQVAQQSSTLYVHVSECMSLDCLCKLVIVCKYRRPLIYNEVMLHPEGMTWWWCYIGVTAEAFT